MKIPDKNLYIAGFFFYLLICISPVLQAGQYSNKIKAYTSNRDKTPENLPLNQPGHPAEIKVIKSGDIYHIKANVVIHAPARHVRHVLTDFKHMYRLNSSIIESAILRRHDDGSVSVKTKVIGCAAYFCEEIARVERVRELPSGELLAEVIADMSQFKSGHTLWRIEPIAEGSEVTYISDIQPDIFIPPVIGEFIIKKAIREEIATTMTNLERISNIVAEKEWQLNYRSELTEFEDHESCIW